MSLTGSRFSSESAPAPLYGVFFVKEFARAIQSRRNLVFGRSKDPNHDAVMRIGSHRDRVSVPSCSKLSR